MEERKQGTQKNGIAIGVQNNEDTIRWLFEQHFSAVACDTVGFEGTFTISSSLCLDMYEVT